MSCDYGEIPGGCNELRSLLYPFYQKYPFKLWSKYRWWKNAKINKLLIHLNEKKKWLTVIDRLGAPGDAIITANFIRCIKNKFSNIQINCITPNPDLIKFDPSINKINQSETFYSINSSYWDLIVRKEKYLNVVEYNLNRIGITEFEYSANFHLHDNEIVWAKNKLGISEKPRIAICTKSKEEVKNWTHNKWIELIEYLKPHFSVIHLGDETEPRFKAVIRFAGKLSIRESSSILSETQLFIGPDSLLMHIANGLNIPSVIIFGGSRPVNCFGYEQNINISCRPSCSPCWVHSGYDKCNHDIKCMTNISVGQVLNSINLLMK